MIQIRPQMDALSISMVMEQLVQLIHSTLLEVINLQINNSQFVSGKEHACLFRSKNYPRVRYRKEALKGQKKCGWGEGGRVIWGYIYDPI